MANYSITKDELTFPDTECRTADVINVTIQNDGPDRDLWWVPILVGLMFLVSVFSMASNPSTIKPITFPLFVLYFGALFGIAYRVRRPIYLLRIRTSSGEEATFYKSANHPKIIRIADEIRAVLPVPDR